MNKGQAVRPAPPDRKALALHAVLGAQFLEVLVEIRSLHRAAAAAASLRRTAAPSPRGRPRPGSRGSRTASAPARVENLPFGVATIASENGLTKPPGAFQSRSPPLSLEPGSFERALASSSNFAPFCSCAMMSLASSSFSTRMCLTWYSLSPICVLITSYSLRSVGVGNRVLLDPVGNEGADQDSLRRQVHLRS